MDIHKPKPVHNLKEFFSEIAVVVCGVIIALALEQGVEELSWAHKVAEARTSLHENLATITVFAQERIAHAPCARARLDALEEALVASPARWRPLPPTYCGYAHSVVFQAPDRPWPTELWKAFSEDGTVSHLPRPYRLQAAFTFGFVDGMARTGELEDQLTPQLNVLSRPVLLTPDARINLLRVIEELKRDEDVMALSSRQVIQQIRALGETPTRQELDRLYRTVPFLYLPSAGREGYAKS